MPDESPAELRCDCGECVLDLRGVDPGSTVTCSFCGMEHRVPGGEKQADLRSRAEREKALMAELKSSGPSDEDLDDLMQELDGQKKLAEHSGRRSDGLSAHLPDPGVRRKIKRLAAYAGVVVVVGLIVYVRFFTGPPRRGGVALDWNRYSAGTWAMIVLAGAGLGLGLYLLHTWLFVYLPRRRKAARAQTPRRRRGAQTD